MYQFFLFVNKICYVFFFTREMMAKDGFSHAEALRPVSSTPTATLSLFRIINTFIPSPFIPQSLVYTPCGIHGLGAQHAQIAFEHYSLSTHLLIRFPHHPATRRMLPLLVYFIITCVLKIKEINMKFIFHCVGFENCRSLFHSYIIK